LKETMSKPKSTRPVGRPPIANPATMRITAKVTPEQHAAWMRLGSSVWLKMMLRKATEAS
jgi:hypothetical protein